MSTGRRPPRPRPERATRAGGRVALWLVGLVAIAAVALIALVMARGGGNDTPVSTTPTTPTTVDVLLVEGLRRSEMATIVAKKTGIPAASYLAATNPSARGRALAGTSRPTSLEGFLFPATYPVDPKAPVGDLVDYQLRTFQERTAGISYAYARRRNLTRYDVLIIASLVEREASNERERGIIAGVMYNRLRLRMRLDIDATVQYALGFWKSELTAADLRSASPYNTRRFPGLPPGPISNPGEGSIRAAANPVPTNYLYYVARADGTDNHYFARTPAQFDAAIAKARANARGG